MAPQDKRKLQEAIHTAIHSSRVYILMLHDSWYSARNAVAFRLDFRALSAGQMKSRENIY